jgi:transglutaminase-like putative cysteine protease
MKFLTVRHATTYRYARKVALGPHRMMLRPRDSHDLRLVEAKLTLSPPGAVRWIHDVFGNSVELVEFSEPAAELYVLSVLELERYSTGVAFTIDPEAATYPFIYSANDRTDLGRLLERHYPDPQEIVDGWAKRFIGRKPTETFAVLSDMNRSIREEFAYNAREQEGTQSPLETLEKRSGTCRDFALLFIEAARSLGFGARFVTGYLYDPKLDGAEGDVQGAAATHAWADIYLPGAGWIEYDPTNASIGAENLIRVAVTRDPSQAIPISGSFKGEAGDFLGLDVEVTVNAKR